MKNVNIFVTDFKLVSKDSINSKQMDIIFILYAIKVEISWNNRVKKYIFGKLLFMKCNMLTSLQVLLKYPILPTCRIRRGRLRHPPHCFPISRPYALDRPARNKRVVRISIFLAKIFF